ncbi:hypothetical protein BDY19DRAFT_242177 [Irpex rosettiformis]|uniref:Uncharacterized protein n=1 Tax=Irpex rosettiformis TaxID=378272 RepID=A0ACB8TYW7_9APHY|nr:hypothetical protein BDY19DRAFT_242177 [Irpex rosettiformis]
MSIQGEPGTNGASNGPGLSVSNGLPLPGSAVNQSAGTAQVQHHPAHHPQDPYASYAPYPSVVTYSTPYPHNTNTSTSAPYYIHTSQGHPAHNDPHHPAHHEPPPPSGHSDPTAQQQQSQQTHHGSQHHLSEVNHQEQIHTSEHVQQPQASYHTPQRSPVEPVPPSPSLVAGTPNGVKRGPPISTGSMDEHTPAPKKRKQRADNVDVKEDCDLGPSGGAKHWTDEEKTRLFHWMLTDDNRWEAFGSKMNTIFREGSAVLFSSRKTFTALKSCYHRNLDVFKQIYAFEAFLAKAPTMPIEPPNSSSPTASSEGVNQQEMQEIADELLPPSFATPAQRQTFLERKLESARNFNVPVGNLTIRALDHWQETGWYILFKRRFREDPQTGMPIARHGSLRHLDDGTSPDGRLDEDNEGPSSALHISRANESLTEAQRRHLDPNDCLIPPPFPNQPPASRGSGSTHRTRVSPPASSSQLFAPGSPVENTSPQISTFPYPPPPPVSYYPPPSTPQGDYQVVQQQINLQAQTAQALTQLTNMTQTLLGTCTTLTELVRTQMEDTKAQTDLMRKREDRDASGSSASGSGSETQRAALATDILANPRAPEEIKKLAADYLKRLFQ